MLVGQYNELFMQLGWILYKDLLDLLFVSRLG